MRDRFQAERDATRAGYNTTRALVVIGIFAIMAIVGIALGAWLTIARADEVSTKKKDMPKFAAPLCMPLTSILGTLLGRYHEAPLFTGRIGKEDAIMWVVNQDSGTFTLLAACDADHARVILAGTDFHPADITKLLGPQL
jgi:hypothetical protein